MTLHCVMDKYTDVDLKEEEETLPKMKTERYMLMLHWMIWSHRHPH